MFDNIKMNSYKKKLNEFVDKYINPLNNSKYFAGLCMIMLNIGSKYITIELSKTQEQFLKNSVARLLLIFSISWIGTREIVTSFFITAAFIVMTEFLFNEKSALCIIPQGISEKLMNEIDLNNDDKISEEELKQALNVLQKAKKLSNNK